MFEKDLNISFLLDFYGEVLPENQRDILDLYYNEDLSLSEIAENRGISRQGVRHNLKRGEDQLIFLEEKLGLAKKSADLKSAYETIAKILESVHDGIISGADRAHLAAEINKAAAIAVQSYK